MDEEVRPTEPTENTPSLDYPSNEEIPPTEDFTNYVIDGVTDDRTLMGTVMQTVFGNFEVMVFIVTATVLVTLLIISTDFMQWKERE
ncbi:hypothetical protein [Lysinibacillus sp. D3C2_S12]|uniref:hypothetical protein n=1 Tax=Lysinibacillus sp. D3C2_S12 TaxID=2941226 RepID=UPI0020BF5070|nr:hypothetical protein [Lysinibacillus sp. D3C2_S12]